MRPCTKTLWISFICRVQNIHPAKMYVLRGSGKGPYNERFTGYLTLPLTQQRKWQGVLKTVVHGGFTLCMWVRVQGLRFEFHALSAVKKKLHFFSSYCLLRCVNRTAKDPQWLGWAKPDSRSPIFLQNNPCSALKYFHIHAAYRIFKKKSSDSSCMHHICTCHLLLFLAQLISMPEWISNK